MLGSRSKYSSSSFPPRAEGAEPKHGLIQPVTSVSHQKKECGQRLNAPGRVNRAFASNVGQQVEIFVIFVFAAFSFTEQLLRFDKLDPLDPFDHLVAKLEIGRASCRERV